MYTSIAVSVKHANDKVTFVEISSFVKQKFVMRAWSEVIRWRLAIQKSTDAENAACTTKTNQFCDKLQYFTQFRIKLQTSDSETSDRGRGTPFRLNLATEWRLCKDWPASRPYVAMSTSMRVASELMATLNAAKTLPNTVTARHPNLFVSPPTNGPEHVHVHIQKDYQPVSSRKHGLHAK